jgi:hypothetical protein
LPGMVTPWLRFWNPRAVCCGPYVIPGQTLSQWRPRFSMAPMRGVGQCLPTAEVKHLGFDLV